MNPVDEFLALMNGTEKTAAPNLRNFSKAVGRSAATGLGTAVAGAGVAAVGVAASKIWDAVTKARDFKQMMGSSFNEDLHQLHAMKPKEFNETYSSLRMFNPTFAQDPMVAGTYMRRAMKLDPKDAGGVMVEALQHRKNLPDSAIGEAFQRGGISGAGAGMTEHGRERGEKKKHEQQLGMKAQEQEQRVMNMALQEYMKRIPDAGEQHGQPPEFFRDIGVGKTSF